MYMCFNFTQDYHALYASCISTIYRSQYGYVSKTKIEDRRPKNEDLITFRPVKLQADEPGLNALKDAKIKRIRRGLRFVEKAGSNYKTKTQPFLQNENPFEFVLFWRLSKRLARLIRLWFDRSKSDDHEVFIFRSLVFVLETLLANYIVEVFSSVLYNIITNLEHFLPLNRPRLSKETLSF